MTATDTVFAGSIPAHLRPMPRCRCCSSPMPSEVAHAGAASQPRRILETAAGTGIVTAGAAARAARSRDRRHRPQSGDARRRGAACAVRQCHVPAGRRAGAPVRGCSFDLVVCQFGVMFFPDKVKGNSEARRVLRDGGRYLAIIWDELDRNPVSHVDIGGARGRVSRRPAALPRAHAVRLRGHRADRDATCTRRVSTDVEIETVELEQPASRRNDAATGMCQGSPMRAEIEERGLATTHSTARRSRSPHALQAVRRAGRADVGAIRDRD